MSMQATESIKGKRDEAVWVEALFEVTAIVEQVMQQWPR